VHRLFEDAVFASVHASLSRGGNEERAQLSLARYGKIDADVRSVVFDVRVKVRVSKLAGVTQVIVLSGGSSEVAERREIVRSVA
jgi:hypothetical protein